MKLNTQHHTFTGNFNGFNTSVKAQSCDFDVFSGIFRMNSLMMITVYRNFIMNFSIDGTSEETVRNNAGRVVNTALVFFSIIQMLNKFAAGHNIKQLTTGTDSKNRHFPF